MTDRCRKYYRTAKTPSVCKNKQKVTKMSHCAKFLQSASCKKTPDTGLMHIVMVNYYKCECGSGLLLKHLKKYLIRHSFEPETVK